MIMPGENAHAQARENQQNGLDAKHIPSRHNPITGCDKTIITKTGSES